MIPIEKFEATTDLDRGHDAPSVPCTVVGIMTNEDGDLDFVVVLGEDGDLWPSHRPFVRLADGRPYHPE